MRFYWPIAKIDAEQRMVWGYASTEALDDQGESVTCEALAAALDDYMRFANIREMHRNSAVGVAKEADIDDKGLYLGAKIVDDDAWRKVVEGVYKGFSIGGRITARDRSDRKVITGLKLTEISVVDRPANPEAVFDCWKRSPAPAAAGEVHRGLAGGGIADPARLARIALDLEWLRGCIAADPAPPEPAGLDLVERLRKALRPDVSPLAADLARLAGEVVPRLDALQQRVEEIARTPLPAQTVARGIVSVAKHEDGGVLPAARQDIVAALARMTEEERTLTLIKAAHANPIRPTGPLTR